MGREGSTCARVYFEISREIAAAEKSFIEGEFIKKCMLGAVSLICRSKIKKFQYVSLSSTNVQRRADDVAENVTNQLH